MEAALESNEHFYWYQVFTSAGTHTATLCNVNFRDIVVNVAWNNSAVDARGNLEVVRKIAHDATLYIPALHDF